MGAQIFGGPFVAIVATVYTTWVLGPHALLGMLVFILYYPVQYGVSLLTGEGPISGAIVIKFFHIINRDIIISSGWSPRLFPTENDDCDGSTRYANEGIADLRQVNQNVRMGKTFLQHHFR